MSKPIIEVENLGKKYYIGENIYGRGARTFRDLLDYRIKNLFNKTLQDKEKNQYNAIWALKDINFSINEGEAVGIIGKNGAGKSTLLKVLSRITEPTKGKITLRGRVASLLEVGTGFNLELTGRENIYLNGAILGMRKFEINRKFDEIVEFAEVEKFIDTPVKRYSSGMYLRLAFAVAAHLDPDILIVDEVLAVGDAQFQNKCLGKMNEVSRSEGRTILFVSHNMAAIQQLCNRGIMLLNGKIHNNGKVDEVTKEYLGYGLNDNNKCQVDLLNFTNRKGSKQALFEWVELQDTDGRKTNEFSIGEDLNIIFKIASNNTVSKVKLAIEIKGTDGLNLCNMVDEDSGFELGKLVGSQIIKVCLNDVRFYPGQYFITLWAGNVTSTDDYDYVMECISFKIIDGGALTMRKLPRSAGIFFFTPEWEKMKYHIPLLIKNG